MRASSETYDLRKRRSRMGTHSRVALALASLLLLMVYVFPIWKINLKAPQYPEGLGLYIEVNTIRGAQPGNLESINGLNHYIGMKAIHPDAIPELKIMPWIFGAMIALGLAAAVAGRKGMLYTWVGLFLILVVVGLVDFYMWEYDYGHNLDHERAIIKVPGMTYQPPLIGSKTMLNITATSLPALGGIAAFISLGVGLITVWYEWRVREESSGRSKVKAVPVLLAGALLLTSCTKEPRPIRYGEDVCQNCKMTIFDARFAAELVTRTGRVLTFDSIECMAGFIALEAPDVRSSWVTDLANPGKLMRAEDAYFVKSSAIASPMGGHLAAFASEVMRDKAILEKGGDALTWREIVAMATPESIHSETGSHSSTHNAPTSS